MIPETPLNSGDAGSNTLSHPLRIVFFGTPAFAVPTLEALVADAGISVVGIVTQPDKPTGRGQKLMPPPVKAAAQALGLACPVFQPVKTRTDEPLFEALRALKADAFVTIAFGQILPQVLLDIPRMGTVNVHASLLPELRGANPIQWAILQDKPETGITTMLTDAGVDTGAMLLKAQLPILPDETAAELAERLAQMGGPLLLKTLYALHAGTLAPIDQINEHATHAPKLAKQDALCDWQQPARTLWLKIRGQQPWPGVQTFLGGQPVKLLRAALTSGEALKAVHTQAQPGSILGVDTEGAVQGLIVACGPQGDQRLTVTQLQMAGKKAMPALDWWRGLPAAEQQAARFEAIPAAVAT
ncbi:MAG: methionyl-tRNA formyltransferase [Vampirovibrionales bacterium]|nr:methionyl-tRNA formyltransferase [Vampirovibrionales bacterium]